MVQYGIIIGIVIIALIPIFFIFGNTIYKQFENFYLGLKTKGKTITKQDTSTINNITAPTEATKQTISTKPITFTKPVIPVKPSVSFGGTREKPVMKCVNGSCSIDYGDFVLQGIPENFSEFVETHGTSGATDKIASLIEEVNQQLDDESEIPIKNFLQSVISMIGTDNTDGRQGDAKEIQYAYHMKIYECMAGGSCDGIVESSTSPGTYYHERNSRFTFHIPPHNSAEEFVLRMQLSNIIGGQYDQLINREFETVKEIFQNVSNNNGKDYSNHIVVIEALKNYALDLRAAMFEEIRDKSISPNPVKKPSKVDIESVRSNVASKTEDDTASLMCAISGTSCSK